MIVTLEETKDFMRLGREPTEEDNILTTMILAAEGYLENATGRKFTAECALAKLAIWVMVTHWYDNRMAVAISTISKELEFSLQSMLITLKYMPLAEEPTLVTP